MNVAADIPDISAERQRIAELEAELKAAREELEKAESSLASLHRAYRRALEELQLLKRRLFIARAERFDTEADQLAFDKLIAEVDRLRALVEQEEGPADEDGSADEDEDEDEDKDKRKRGGGRGKRGRRNLEESSLPLERVELLDPELEGKFTRIGFDDDSYQIAYKRGYFRIQLARAVYDVSKPVPAATPAPTGGPVEETSVAGPADEAAASARGCEVDRADEAAASAPGCEVDRADEAAASARGCEVDRADEAAASARRCGVDRAEEPRPAQAICGAGVPASPSFVKAALPKTLFRRSLLAPSMIARVLTSKYMLGVPFYRLEQKLALEGAPLDRGTMCRYAEDAGATLGAIVEAARVEAMATAFCLSTDATGVAIQLGPIADRETPRRGACRKGHFFVVLADRDHVFFEYQARHTSAAVCEMFKGFTGYIQADAHAIYDALFRGTSSKEGTDGDERGPPPLEVGCWCHCRRKFFDAAVCKHELGVEGLRRIDRIFVADQRLAGLPPAKRKILRDQIIRPLVDDFFAWARAEHAKPRERGLVRSALGYAINQEQALRRFLDDGRLRLDNNASERGLRPIAVGRKAWLFCGSDDHASAAANLFSLIASCKLHRLDPHDYLADVIRVMPYWPRDRYLELAPRYWAGTRARLDPAELAKPVGHITVPPPLPAREQPPPS